ncbi:glycosyltransferase family 39 protein [Hortaea werneckii]|nr:glycosyltransferase family 39 protein [Hortaea werneckii]
MRAAVGDELADREVCRDEMTYIALSVHVSEATLWMIELVLVKADCRYEILGNKGTYRDTVGVLLSNALGLRLTLLERVLVFELGTHRVGCRPHVHSVIRQLSNHLRCFSCIPGEPVQAEAAGQYGEVKSRVIVVHVGDTRHGHEGKIVEEPTQDRVDTRVVEVIELLPCEFIVATLPADSIPNDHADEKDDRESRAPVDRWVAEQEVFDNVVVPAAHTQANVEKRPLPWLGGKVVLFVRVWDQCVVGGHHRDVEVNKVTEEWGLVCGRVSLLDYLLLTVPARRSSVINHFDSPMIFRITNRDIAVASHFQIGLSHRRGNLVRVKIATCLSMNETDDIAIADVFEGRFHIEVSFEPVRVPEPVVVRVFVVVAGDLLLVRAFRESLNVGMQQTTAIAHVLQCGTGAKSDLKRAVLANLGALQVGLEERRHLRVARAAVLEDQEVDPEGEHVDDQGDDNQANDTEAEVGCQSHLRHPEVAELVPEVFDGPMEIPVMVSHSAHSGPKGQ